MKRIYMIFLWIFVGAIGVTASDVKVLTLEQSVNLALEQNHELQIAAKEVDKSKASVWEAYSTILPSVNASTNFQKSWDIQTTTMPNFMKVMLRPQPGALPPDVESVFTEFTDAMPDYISFAFGLENTWTYGAQLTQPLFLGGAGIAGIQMANAAKDAAKSQYESKRQHLIYQTAVAWYQCLLAKHVVKVQTEALKQAEANLDVVRKKYRVGSASGFDKMRAEVDVANLRPASINAKNAYKSALTGLRTLLGFDDDVKIEITGELGYHEDQYSEMSLDTLKQIGFSHRSEIRGLKAQKKIASKGVALARSQFLPRVFFQTDYSYLAMRNDYKFVQDDFSKGFTSAVSVQIPLFTGLKNCKQYQKARLDYKISVDMEKQATDGILADIEVSYHGFHEAQEKWMAAKESVALAVEALRLANLMYDEGASTQLDVLSSRLALTQAQLNHAMVLFEYQQARYNLRRAIGVLDGVIE